MTKFEKWATEIKGVSNLKEKGAEELAGLYNEYNDFQAKAMESLIEAKASKEDIETLKSELKSAQIEQLKSLNEALKEQGLMIKKMSQGDKAARVATIKDALESNRSKFADLKNNKSGSVNFEVKTVGTMLESANISGGNVPVEQRIPGFDFLPSRKTRLLDIVTPGTAESNIISWVSQAGQEGAAGQTAEGALKNQIDFNLVVSSQALKKTTAYIKISKEMLEDIDFIDSAIKNELMREVLKKVEAQVYNGDNTGNNQNGINNTAVTFAAGTFAGTVDNANEVDVLVVAMNQIEIAEQGAPNYILMHPSDVAKLKLIKVSSTDDRYIDRLQMVGSELSLDGVPIIKTTLITVGNFLVGNFDFAQLYSKGSLTIDTGYENDDFTKNLVTILCEWRGLTLVKTNERSAFVKGVFATAAAALETA